MSLHWLSPTFNYQQSHRPRKFILKIWKLYWRGFHLSSVRPNKLLMQNFQPIKVSKSALKSDQPRLQGPLLLGPTSLSCSGDQVGEEYGNEVEKWPQPVCKDYRAREKAFDINERLLLSYWLWKTRVFFVVIVVVFSTNHKALQYKSIVCVGDSNENRFMVIVKAHMVKCLV